MSRTKKILITVVILLVAIPFVWFVLEVNKTLSYLRNRIPNYDYSDWKSVAISDKWGFSVPNEWVITQDENVLYFTDKPIDEEDCTTYLIGIIGVIAISADFRTFLNDFYGVEVSYVNPERESRMIASKSNYFKEVEYEMNGESLFLDLISFSYDSTTADGVKIALIVNGDLIDDEMIDMIGTSFREIK